MSYSVLTPAIEALRKSRDECLRILEANEDFQALRAIDRALDQLRAASEPRSSVRVSDGFLDAILNSRTDRGVPEKISQSAAAIAVLMRDGPLPVADLLPRVRAEGAVVGGSDPEVNLSSSLSRDGRFVSFKRDSKYYWTLKTDVTRLVLGEQGRAPEYGGSTGAVTPAAVDNQSQEGGEAS